MSIQTDFDVVVIGGGIVGSGVFRELSLHNISTLLIDKSDFCSQTSQGSSKMLHGGIRYLENLDFGLVEEALEEKNLWLKLAPHLTQEALFHLPVYNDSKYPLSFVQMGLFLYDALSHFKNKPHSRASVAQTIERFPEIASENLTGSGMYHDAIVDDHKLGLECIYDGLLSPHSQALSYHEVQECHYFPEYVDLKVFDTITQKTKKIKAKYVVFATGPFTDQLMKNLNLPWTPCMSPSKGVHLWLKPTALKLWGPLLLNLKDGRVLFVIPQREAILVGTTETKTNENFFDLKATTEDIDYLLNALSTFFPHSRVTKQDIFSTTAAIRPLVRDNHSDKLGKISRTHKIFRPHSRSFALLGGKYTTFRRMAQDLNKILIPLLDVRYESHLTLNQLRVHSLHQTFSPKPLNEDEIKSIIETEMCKNWNDLYLRRLSQIKNESTLLQKPREYWESLINSYQR